MVINSASNVITLKPEKIKLAPERGTALNSGYLIGLDTIEEQMGILIDVDQLMSIAKMDVISKADRGSQES